MSRDLGFTVTASQASFLALDCAFPAFIGGVGSGKSHAMAISAIMDASQSSNAIIALYEPTHDHIKRIILPKIEEMLVDNGIIYTHNKQDHIIYTSSNQFGDFIFRSLENPTMIVGYEAFRSHVDELDVLTEEKAREAWMKVIARNRQRPKGIENPKNRVSAYSTPEGYKFMYKMWGCTTNPDYQMVKAKTKDNPYLQEAWIQSLVDTYPHTLINAYLEGEFVNLNTTTVYSAYDRAIHNSSETIVPRETLFIGCDFNVNKTAATIYVKRNGGQQWHAVAELTDMLDAQTMTNLIKEQWYNKGHNIVIYPDCSGASRSNANANISAIAVLQQAGFEVRAHRKNPDVRDRVQAVNKAFTNGRLYINSKECPTVSRCLEQQSYDKNGEPDKKSGNDHQNDASTYPIAYEMAIKKPMFALDFSFVT